MRSRVSLLIRRTAQRAIAANITNLMKVKVVVSKIKQPMVRMTSKRTKQPMRKITLAEEKS
jgi:uncharacterized protein (UPF0548 family)